MHNKLVVFTMKVAMFAIPYYLGIITVWIIIKALK